MQKAWHIAQLSQAGFDSQPSAAVAQVVCRRGQCHLFLYVFIILRTNLFCIEKEQKKGTFTEGDIKYRYLDSVN
jgi:hypothetical protein